MSSATENTCTLVDDLGFLCHHIEGLFNHQELGSWQMADEKARKALHRAKTFLRGSEMQAIMFSVVFNKGISGRRTDIDDLAKHLGTESYRMLNYVPQLGELVRKGVLFETNRYEEIGYRITEETMKAILDNEPEIKERFQNLSQEQLLEEFSRLMRQCDRDDINTQELKLFVNSMLDANAELELCKKMTALDLQYEEKCILLAVIDETLSDGNGLDLFPFLNRLVSRLSVRTKLKMMFLKGETVLLQKDYLHFDKGGFFQAERVLKLTEIGAQHFLGEQAMLHETKISAEHTTFIQHENIDIKPLFFAPETSAKYAQLAKLMQAEQMHRITERLREKKMPEGFCALFYGAPGTGKTESVMQLAAQSGRSILMVNISDIRDKFVGESEKRLAEVFRSYEKIRKRVECAPILFFNEADALIGKRISVSNSVDQMNNSMQNILLQHLEQFKGLFLATTNMADQMDEAFERRFLFKVSFAMPDVDTRALIWKSKIDGLDDSSYRHLAEHFILSGGQIENVARKAEIDFILEGGEVTCEKIARYAQDERLNPSSNRNKIGFRSSQN